MSQGQRRLAAIMFTDMVGYTALGQRNESLSLALVEEQRKLIRPALSRHNGREIKTMGDAFLVEFPNAVDGVRCAYDIQRTIREFNLSLAPNKRIHLRIGLHVGEVIESRGDISGDAVNIASRIEPLAEDGGVCITRQVFDHIKNKVDLSLASIGPRSLKNVTEPIEVYKMVMPWEGERAEKRLDKLRIAVLPFANMSPDPADEYFADGMTEEVISTLSSISGLRVIARTSIMGYKGGHKKISDVAQELGVGTVLEGSVRKVGDRVRVSVQLIDSETSEHLWAESYDRDLKDLLAIQSDISTIVAEALRIQLLSRERAFIGGKRAVNPDPYILYLKGRYYWNERTVDGTSKAIKYFEEAVRLDTRFGLGFAGLADCYNIYADYGWRTPKEAWLKTKEYALRAIEIDHRLAEPHASLGNVHANYEYSWRESEDEFKRAVELKASYATAYHWYSLALFFMGRYDEAYEQIRQASELDPLSRIIGVNEARGLLLLGELKKAIGRLEKVIEANPDYALPHWLLGWINYLESRTGEAIDELRKSVILSGSDTYYRAELACVLGFARRLEEANEIIKELEDLSKTRYIDKVKIAIALFGVGRTDDAFGYLEQGYEERSNTILYFGGWPWFKEVRKDPRWASLEKRLGLPVR